MSLHLTTAEYIALIDRIDLHLLTETLLRVSAQIQLPEISLAFSSPSEKKSLSVSVENKDGKCFMHFALLVEKEQGKANHAVQISGVK